MSDTRSPRGQKQHTCSKHLPGDRPHARTQHVHQIPVDHSSHQRTLPDPGAPFNHTTSVGKDMRHPSASMRDHTD